MRFSIRSVIGMAAVLFLTASSAMAAGVLDGKTFTGAIGDKGKPASAKDDLVFAGGKFKSSLCDKAGYGMGDYTAKAAGDAVSFKAHTSNANGGQMDWNGVFMGGELDATAVTHEKGKDSVSWFRGVLKK